MNQYILAQQGPLAQPWSFLFGTDDNGEPREWPLLPLATAAVAEEMETWAMKAAAKRCERLKPHPQSTDETEWRIYREWSALTRSDLNMGMYGAFTTNWSIMLQTDEDAIAEAIFQSVRLKEPTWTRGLMNSLLSQPEHYRSVRQAYFDLNFAPKAKPGDEPGQSPHQKESTGDGSSNG